MENYLCKNMNSDAPAPLLLLPSPLSWLRSSGNSGTRESWLNELMYRLAEYMESVEPGSCEKLPDWRVSVGWPFASRKAIGQCWSAVASKGGKVEIFISPELDEVPDLDHVLLHEMVHASVGTAAKHGPIFRKLAVKLGLEGKMTATHAGEALRKKLDEIIAGMPPFPHAGLRPSQMGRKIQTTRMIKCACEECGYVIRTTNKWLEKGIPSCYCGGKFNMAA